MASATQLTAILRLGFDIPFGAEWKGDYDALVQALDKVIGRQVRTLVAGTTTLVAGDAFTYARSPVGACTINIPNNTAVSIRTGCEYTFRQTGAGAITLVPASGVTLNLPMDGTVAGTRGVQDTVRIKKVGTNEWDMIQGAF